MSKRTHARMHTCARAHADVHVPVLYAQEESEGASCSFEVCEKWYGRKLYLVDQSSRRPAGVHFDSILTPSVACEEHVCVSPAHTASGGQCGGRGGIFLPVADRGRNPPVHANGNNHTCNANCEIGAPRCSTARPHTHRKTVGLEIGWERRSGQACQEPSPCRVGALELARPAMQFVPQALTGVSR